MLLTEDQLPSSGLKQVELVGKGEDRAMVCEREMMDRHQGGGDASKQCRNFSSFVARLVQLMTKKLQRAIANL